MTKKNKTLKAMMILAIIYSLLLGGSLIFYMCIGANSDFEGNNTLLGCYMTESAPVGSVICKSNFLGTIIENVSMLSINAVWIAIWSALSIKTISITIILISPLIYLIWFGFYSIRNLDLK